MLQTMRCIRFGEVLLDENRRAFLLCNNCHTDYSSLEDFRKHLECCEGLENFFRQNTIFKFGNGNSTHLQSKLSNGVKEYAIYNFNEIDGITTQLSANTQHHHSDEKEECYMDIINIEEELLNPRWYTDIASVPDNAAIISDRPKKTTEKALQYDELVEAVTPFVQFKENVKSSSYANNGLKLKRGTGNKLNRKDPTSQTVSGNVKGGSAAKGGPSIQKIETIESTMLRNVQIKSKSADQPLKRATRMSVQPVGKRQRTNNISKESVQVQPEYRNGFCIAPKQESNALVFNIKDDICDEQQVKMNGSTLNVILNPVSPATNKNSTSTVNTSTKEEQTAQILNKLQTLGLQIKRTQPASSSNESIIKNEVKTDEKTLELLWKLQSKGMKVKILHKETQNINNSQATVIAKNLQDQSDQVIKSTILPFKQNLTKNIIIKKIN